MFSYFPHRCAASITFFPELMYDARLYCVASWQRIVLHCQHVENRVASFDPNPFSGVSGHVTHVDTHVSDGDPCSPVVLGTP